MKFKNGSEVNTIKCDNVVRGSRSKTHGFYCNYCDVVHVDYPRDDTHYIGDFICCKYGFDRILEEIRTI